MSKVLRTDFKRIGRSGSTVDGRVIEPEALVQAAKNYDKEMFTALIWPEHERWYNMGTVEELKAEKNSEGGMDLLAVIAPNDYYLSINKAGQKLFSSMELMPNFRDSGEYYLTGMAATDSPASAATQEMRFSALNNKDALISSFTEQIDLPQDEPPTWFKRLFSNSEDPMSKQALAALAQKFTALEQKLDTVIAGGSDSSKTTTEKDAEKDDFSALSATVQTLTEKFNTLEARLNQDNQPPADPMAQFKNELTQLSTDFKQLKSDFDQAVKEENGTNAGEHLGDVDHSELYL